MSDLNFLDVTNVEVREKLYRLSLEILQSAQVMPGICCSICTAGLILAYKYPLTVPQAYHFLDSVRMGDFMLSPTDDMRFYPELLAEKPYHIQDSFSFWFEPYEKEPRIEIMKRIISKFNT